MNVELLRQVQEKIKAEPKLFQMPEVFKQTDCGTACCFLGWALVLSGSARNWTAYPGYSWDVFDIDPEQSNNLINSRNWPEPFRSRFAEAEEADDKIAQAEIACLRIDHFIETGE